MGIISTIAGVVGGKVVDRFTGNIGNKVIDTVNDFLSPEDKLSKDASPEELMESYYGKLTPEDRVKANERFIELENEAERINVELQKVMVESDKISGHRKWVAIIMSITISIICLMYSYMIFEYFKMTGELPEYLVIAAVYGMPFVLVLVCNGYSSRMVKELVLLFKPKEKSAGENAVNKVIDSISKKR